VSGDERAEIAEKRGGNAGKEYQMIANSYFELKEAEQEDTALPGEDDLKHFMLLKKVLPNSVSQKNRGK